MAEGSSDSDDYMPELPESMKGSMVSHKSRNDSNGRTKKRKKKSRGHSRKSLDLVDEKSDVQNETEPLEMKNWMSSMDEKLAEFIGEGKYHSVNGLE